MTVTQGNKTRGMGPVWCLLIYSSSSKARRSPHACVLSDILRLVDGTVTAHIPLHPLEEVDHGALQQQATQDSKQGELSVDVQSHWEEGEQVLS